MTEVLTQVQTRLAQVHMSVENLEKVGYILLNSLPPENTSLIQIRSYYNLLSGASDLAKQQQLLRIKDINIPLREAISEINNRSFENGFEKVILFQKGGENNINEDIFECAIQCSRIREDNLNHLFFSFYKKRIMPGQESDYSQLIIRERESWISRHSVKKNITLEYPMIHIEIAFSPERLRVKGRQINLNMDVLRSSKIFHYDLNAFKIEHSQYVQRKRKFIEDHWEYSDILGRGKKEKIKINKSPEMKVIKEESSEKIPQKRGVNKIEILAKNFRPKLESLREYDDTLTNRALDYFREMFIN